YTIKYSTKPQQDLENSMALNVHAFGKAIEGLLQNPDDPVALGRRRVLSMCCTLTNPDEVSSPMAYLYILNESAMYASHTLVKLHLFTVLRALFYKDQLLDVRLETDVNGENLTPSSVWLDHIYRQGTQENINLMSFVSQWERKKSNSGKRFLEDHSLYESHSLFNVPVKRIVPLCPKRLPDICNQDYRPLSVCVINNQ
ncbi:hypothetical protein PHMEG_00030086, partial [Phytophthora megakarya]